MKNIFIFGFLLCALISAYSQSVSISASPTTHCANVSASPISISSSGTVYAYAIFKSVNGGSYNSVSSNSGLPPSSYSPGILEAGTNQFYCRIFTSSSYIESNTISYTVKAVTDAGTLTPSAQSLCPGETPYQIAFSQNPSGGNNSFTYFWQSSDDNSLWGNAPGSNTTNIYSPPASSTIKYYRCNVTGQCSSDATEPVSVSIKSVLPEITVGNSQIICMNTAPAPIEIKTPTVGFGVTNYAWQSSNTGAEPWTGVGTNTDELALGTMDASKYYKCVVTSECITRTSASNVFIDVRPTVQSGSINFTQEICYDTKPAALVNQYGATLGIEPYTYKWQYSSDSIAWNNIDNSNTLGYEPGKLTSKTHYRRQVTDNCNVTQTSNVLSVRVKPKLPIPQTNLDGMYCKDSLVSIRIVNPNSVNKWFESDYDFIKDDTIFTIENLSSSVSLYLQSFDENNCKSDSIKLDINMDPVKANFIRVSNEESAEGTIVKFRSTSTGANSYIWDLGVGTLYYVAEPSTVYNAPGIYDAALTVTSINGCVDSYTLEDAVNVYPLAINEHIDGSLFVYPLPVTDELTIEYSGTSVSNAFIYNISGQVVFEKQVGNGKNEFKLSSLVKGTYILNVVTQDGKVYSKVMTKQ